MMHIPEEDDEVREPYETTDPGVKTSLRELPKEDKTYLGDTIHEVRLRRPTSVRRIDEIRMLNQIGIILI